MPNGANPQEQAWQRQYDKGTRAGQRRQKEQEEYGAKQAAELKAAALPQQAEMAGYKAGKEKEMAGYKKGVEKRAGVKGVEGDKMKARDLGKVKKQAMELKKKIKAGEITGAAKEAAFAAMQQLTKHALTQAWANLIDSFGATFLYIIFHGLCRYSYVSMDLRNMFCPYGVLIGLLLGGGAGGAGGGAGGGATGGIGKAMGGGEGEGEGGIMGEATELVNKGAELVEIAVVLMLCAILAAAILVSMLPYIIIGYMIYVALDGSIGDKWEAVKALWGAGVKDLWDIISGML